MEQARQRPGRSAGTRYPRKLPLYETDEGMALLHELARRRGVSATALMRQLVREEAARVGLTAAPGPPASASPTPSGATAEPAQAPSAGNGERPVINLRALAERARAGDREAEAEMKRVIARLQAEAVIRKPAQGDLTPAERDARWQRFVTLAEQVRAGAPTDLTPEELEREIERAVDEVREQRRARQR